MTLEEFISILRNDVKMLTGENNPEITFSSCINKNETCGFEYDGVYQLDEGKVVIYINYKDKDEEEDNQDV